MDSILLVTVEVQFIIMTSPLEQLKYICSLQECSYVHQNYINQNMHMYKNDCCTNYPRIHTPYSTPIKFKQAQQYHATPSGQWLPWAKENWKGEGRGFSVQLAQFSRSVLSDSLRPHELQHAKSPCPSPTPGVHSDSHPLSLGADNVHFLNNVVIKCMCDLCDKLMSHIFLILFLYLLLFIL